MHLAHQMNISFGRHTRLTALALALAASLAACGGSGGSNAAAPPTGDTAQRIAAASATATSASNSCSSVRPFYWELGDVSGALASASVNATGSSVTFGASTAVSIASASKWLYSSYVVERRGSAGLSTSDIKFLNFRSGYTNFTGCQQGQTVGECVADSTNGEYTAANDGKFLYDGGHMEVHANLDGLGPLANNPLATELRGQLGTDIAFAYSQPQLAGGVYANADNYARFLRKLLGGQLRMSAALGSNPVCTNPLTCPSAVGTPIPGNESWHYSIGHWVEDDPTVGDGSFSSPGAFGFYP